MSATSFRRRHARPKRTTRSILTRRRVKTSQEERSNGLPPSPSPRSRNADLGGRRSQFITNGGWAPERRALPDFACEREIAGKLRATNVDVDESCGDGRNDPGHPGLEIVAEA